MSPVVDQRQPPIATVSTDLIKSYHIGLYTTRTGSNPSTLVELAFTFLIIHGCAHVHVRGRRPDRERRGGGEHAPPARHHLPGGWAAHSPAPRHLPGLVCSVPRVDEATGGWKIPYVTALELTTPFVVIEVDAVDFIWAAPVVTVEAFTRWAAAIAGAHCVVHWHVGSTVPQLVAEAVGGLDAPQLLAPLHQG